MDAKLIVQVIINIVDEGEKDFNLNIKLDKA
jgi:hypothetical protein